MSAPCDFCQKMIIDKGEDEDKDDEKRTDYDQKNSLTIYFLLKARRENRKFRETVSD